MSHEAFVLCPLDATCPATLAATPDRPVILYVRGCLALSAVRSLAVVGTREPTPRGPEIAQRIVAHFAQRGWNIVSGLALGIDACAHRAALEVSGHTVAVLAHGLDTVYPAAHRGLAQQILESGGALVSEYAFGMRVSGPHAVAGDRIQAGLSSGVLLVQTGERGGSLHASRAALEYGRVLGLPVPLPSEAGLDKVAGVRRLLEATPDEARRFLSVKRHVDASQLVALAGRDDYAGFESILEGDAPRPGAGHEQSVLFGSASG